MKGGDPNSSNRRNPFSVQQDSDGGMNFGPKMTDDDGPQKPIT